MEAHFLLRMRGREPFTTLREITIGGKAEQTVTFPGRLQLWLLLPSLEMATYNTSMGNIKKTFDHRKSKHTDNTVYKLCCMVINLHNDVFILIWLPCLQFLFNHFAPAL